MKVGQGQQEERHGSESAGDARFWATTDDGDDEREGRWWSGGRRGTDGRDASRHARAVTPAPRARRHLGAGDHEAAAPPRARGTGSAWVAHARAFQQRDQFS